MKHEIEIPDFPAGYEIGKPKVMYAHMGDNSPVYISIPLKKKQPRRIVLEEVEAGHGKVEFFHDRRGWKIVEDKNETRD